MKLLKTYEDFISDRENNPLHDMIKDEIKNQEIEASAKKHNDSPGHASDEDNSPENASQADDSTTDPLIDSNSTLIKTNIQKPN